MYLLYPDYSESIDILACRKVHPSQLNRCIIALLPILQSQIKCYEYFESFKYILGLAYCLRAELIEIQMTVGNFQYDRYSSPSRNLNVIASFSVFSQFVFIDSQNCISDSIHNIFHQPKQSQVYFQFHLYLQKSVSRQKIRTVQ